MSDDTQPAKAPLLLPAPADPSSSSSDPPTVTFGPQTSFKLDKLGPLVVNSDGTVSRIKNWEYMTELERERTLRVLGARNKIRIEQHRTEGDAQTSDVSVDAEAGGQAKQSESPPAGDA